MYCNNIFRVRICYSEYYLNNNNNRYFQVKKNTYIYINLLFFLIYSAPICGIHSYSFYIKCIYNWGNYQQRNTQ